MSIRKLTDVACKGTKGRCVKDRHADGRTAHQHFERKDQAENFVTRLRAERVGGGVVARASTTTFKEYAEAWREAQHWKDPIGPQYAIKRAYPLIGATRISAIDGLTLNKMQRQLFEHPYTRATVEQTMHFVKRALQQAHADRLIPTDPTTRVRLPRRDSLDRNGIVTADQVPTPQEAQAIIAAAPIHYRPGVALGLGCGLRIGEVLGLTADRIDLQAGTITIDRQWQRGGFTSPKTWRGVRTIEPPDVVMFELRRAVKNADAPDVPMFAGARGGGLRRDSFYVAGWRPALKAAGLDERRYKFHSARHFAVSNMLSRGVPIPEVAAYVGDSAETIMTTYAHFLRDSESFAKSALDIALSPLSNDQATSGIGDATTLRQQPSS
jgi:integrase